MEMQEKRREKVVDDLNCYEWKSWWRATKCC